MSDRDPFDHLRDLIDEPVAPRDAFADELRSRLMRELSASQISREEQTPSMNAVIAPRPPLAFPTESVRRIRPMHLLEIAAAAVIILGLAAALSRGWFQHDPDPATAVPAAVLQDETATPETTPEQTATPLPTEVPQTAADATATPAPNTLEPTVVPPGDIPHTIWAVTLPEGESLDFGGMLVDDETVYRLLATSSFVGVQAVDAETGAVKWQQAHQWAGNLFAIEDGTLFFDSGSNELTAVDAETGARLWRASVPGNPIALDTEDDRVFVLTDADMVVALDEQTGDQLWTAQGSIPQNPTGGSARMPATFTIAVEDNIVAAISTYGVLSGFDAATGTELWSHDGYDAATTTIQSEDGVFVVTAAPQTIASELTVLPGGALSATSGTPIGTAASCTDLFAPVMMTVGTPEAGTVAIGTPDAIESGVSSISVSGIQGIDPATGGILWDQQQAPASSTTIDATGSVSMCMVNTATGQLQTLPGSNGAQLDDDHAVIVGMITSETFTPIQSDDEADIVAVLTQIGNISDAPDGFIAIVADDSGLYGTMADGTLIKIGTNQSNTDDHSEDHDDASDDSTPDSDDD